jgi:hypothetical protein
MKEEMKNLAKKAVEDIASKPISRKEAIKKTGYMAVSAATMMLLLNNPAQAGPQGSATSGNNGWGNGDQNAPGNSGGHNNAENGQSKIWKKK